MTTENPFDDIVITFRPDANPEEEECFLSDLAQAIMAIARHVVEAEPLDMETTGSEEPLPEPRA
jgi:hypothetical protein